MVELVLVELLDVELLVLLVELDFLLLVVLLLLLLLLLLLVLGVLVLPPGVLVLPPLVVDEYSATTVILEVTCVVVDQFSLHLGLAALL